jgi:hypothetical protein
MNYKLEYIKSQVEEYAGIIECPESLLPTFGNSRECHPNIEVSDTGILYYEVYERGKPVKMEYPFDVDQLLFIVFHDITYAMAHNYASKHIDPDIDNRRTQFDYQLELLGRLNQQWQQKEREYQKALEWGHPFNDYKGQRQSYLRQLLGSGFLYDEAVEKVNRKYP